MSYQEFKDKVYSYLIKYKKNDLNYDKPGESSRGVVHDCLFDKGDYEKEELPLMLFEPCKVTVKEIQESDFAYKPHIQAFKHVASSQTACINLFVPILESEYANEILKESGIAPKDFDHIMRGEEERLRKGYCFEYWRESKENFSDTDKGLLGDHSLQAGTDSDVAIAYKDKDGKNCLWLIEHKLTEQEFTTCGAYRSKSISKEERAHCTTCSINDILKDPDKCYYHKKCHYKYWEVTKQHASFFTGNYSDDGCPFRGGMNQLWRNQMLALKLEDNVTYDKVYFSVVTHPENNFLDKSMEEYRKLTNNTPKFFTFKSNSLVNAAEKYLPDWTKWYKKVYYGIE